MVITEAVSYLAVEFYDNIERLTLACDFALFYNAEDREIR